MKNCIKRICAFILLISSLTLPFISAYAVVCNHNSWKHTNEVCDTKYYKYTDSQHEKFTWHYKKCSVCGAKTEEVEGHQSFEKHSMKKTNRVQSSAIYPYNKTQHMKITWYWMRCSGCGYEAPQVEGDDTYINHTWKNNGSQKFDHYEKSTNKSKHIVVNVQPRICSVSGCGCQDNTYTVRSEKSHQYGEIKYERRNNKWHAYQLCPCGARKDL